MNRIPLYLPILLILLTACQSDKQSKALQAGLEAKMADLVERNDIPGLNFSLIHPDGRQLDLSAGYADLENELQLETGNVMFSGSIGKTYAVAVLMQLVEEGKADLDRSFKSYFPETAWLNRLPNIELITVRHLLEHSSGLPRYIEAQGVWDSISQNPDKVWSYEERLAFIFDSEPVHEAGAAWAYSDSNYLLIGMLIEKLSAAGYYDQVAARILGPLDLKDTYPAITRKITNLPLGYSRLPAFFRMPGIVVENGTYVFNPQMEWTGGGFASTTADLARWAEAYYTAAAFSDASLKEITTISPNGREIDKNLSYGMGSFIYETRYGQMWAHTGFVPGFQSIFAYLPESSLALALQVNADHASAEMGLDSYLEELLEVIIPGGMERKQR